MGFNGRVSHYDWLGEHLLGVLVRLGVPRPEVQFSGLLSAHGDKFYSYEDRCVREGLHFFHGVGIYLLTHCVPFSREVRETVGGWVDPIEWVFGSKDRFLPFFPPVV